MRVLAKQMLDFYYASTARTPAPLAPEQAHTDTDTDTDAVHTAAHAHASSMDASPGLGGDVGGDVGGEACCVLKGMEEGSEDASVMEEGSQEVSVMEEGSQDASVVTPFRLLSVDAVSQERGKGGGGGGGEVEDESWMVCDDVRAAARVKGPTLLLPPLSGPHLKVE
jgi:hypothetical protein